MPRHEPLKRIFKIAQLARANGSPPFRLLLGRQRAITLDRPVQVATRTQGSSDSKRQHDQQRTPELNRTCSTRKSRAERLHAGKSRAAPEEKIESVHPP